LLPRPISRNTAHRFYLSIAEGLNSADSNAITTQFVATINEVLALASFAIVRGWFRIDDNQVANWSAISNNQGSGWTQINDNQTSSWSAINNTQGSGWSDINDTQNAGWTKIDNTQ